MKTITEILGELRQKYPKRYKAAKALVLLYAFVFILSGLYWSLLFPFSLAPGSIWGDPAERFGLLGDAFGFWNSLFSGAALILVIFSVYLQNKEISEIGKSMKQDGFERTFFNVLDIIAQSRLYVLPFKEYGQHKEGMPPIISVAHALFSGVRSNRDDKSDYSISDCIKDGSIIQSDEITKIANAFFSGNDYMVMTFINSVECALALLFDYTDEQRQIERYGLLIRTVLTNYELDVLSIYGTMDGNETFRKRANRISLFANLDSKLVKTISLDQFYGDLKGSNPEN